MCLQMSIRIQLGSPWVLQGQPDQDQDKGQWGVWAQSRVLASTRPIVFIACQSLFPGLVFLESWVLKLSCPRWVEAEEECWLHTSCEYRRNCKKQCWMSKWNNTEQSFIPESQPSYTRHWSAMKEMQKDETFGKEISWPWRKSKLELGAQKA